MIAMISLYGMKVGGGHMDDAKLSLKWPTTALLPRRCDYNGRGSSITATSGGYSARPILNGLIEGFNRKPGRVDGSQLLGAIFYGPPPIRAIRACNLN